MRWSFRQCSGVEKHTATAYRIALLAVEWFRCCSQFHCSFERSVSQHAHGHVEYVAMKGSRFVCCMFSDVAVKHSVHAWLRWTSQCTVKCLRISCEHSRVKATTATRIVDLENIFFQILDIQSLMNLRVVFTDIVVLRG